jgi:hypothetical protein
VKGFEKMAKESEELKMAKESEELKMAKEEKAAAKKGLSDAQKEQANSLGITPSRVNLSGFKDKEPAKLDKEIRKHEELVDTRIANRIDKAKADSKLTAIDKRRLQLQARLKAVRSGKRPRSYPRLVVMAWIEELKLIEANPKGWKVGWTPNKQKKQTPTEILESMNLD